MSDFYPTRSIYDAEAQCRLETGQADQLKANFEPQQLV